MGIDWSIKTERIKMTNSEITIELQDTEWQLEYIDHDRNIARAIVYDEAGAFYFVQAERDDDFGKATIIETSGGGVEAGEDLLTAIKRELGEELGVEVDVICKIGAVSDYYNLIHRHNINNYFLCKVKSFGDNNLTEAEKFNFHLSTLKLTYDEAVKEYEQRANTRLGKLIAARELPILKRAKEIMEHRFKTDLRNELYGQLALDYCCSIENITDDKNHFTELAKLEGRRRFDGSDECPLKAIVVNGKVIMTGRKEIIEICQKKYEKSSGSWFMDVGKFRELEEILVPFGYKIKTVHPFFIPSNDEVLESSQVEIKKYNQQEILQFKDDDRFDEAYCFDESTPDMLGVAAVIDGKIVGMAGASADSPLSWQIGINVDKEFEGRGIASSLVSILKKDILKLGKLPYYGTAISNLASQKVATKAGFEIAWVELLTEKL